LKAIILSPGLDESLLPFTYDFPKAMMPVVNKPILLITLLELKSAGIRDVKICLHHLPEFVDNYFKDGSNIGLNISYSIEKEFRGSGNSLFRIKSFITDSIIYISGECISNIDFQNLADYHRSHNAIATLVTSNDTLRELNVKEGLLDLNAYDKIMNENLFYDILIIERAGVDQVRKEDGYKLKNHLIPDMLQTGLPVYVKGYDSYYSELKSIDEYHDLNMKTVKGEIIFPAIKLNPEKNSSGALILKGKNSKVSSSVKYDGCVIIGEEVYIDEGAELSNCVILNNTYIGKRVEIKNSVNYHQYHYNAEIKYTTLIEDPALFRTYHVVPFKVRLDSWLINSTDRIVSFFALLMLMPVFIIVALLIKIDSKGPVFYISKRLRSPEISKKGSEWYIYMKEKPIKYYVFRTMYIDSDNRIQELTNKYETGPFRKIENDPRVTKIGRILRKTSIDELPLLWNVLKGQMSLVGIWALPTYEAEDLLHKGLKLDEGDLDLSEVAKVRFRGKLGLAGLWQARGRSDLTAEERALHDTMQSVMQNINLRDEKYLGEYSEFKTYKGYLKMLFETFKSVVLRKGAI
jgi:Nucleoside-diphosphate-sugar pyrophosphorylase involved in lipopolysaccharide biosynthesis/translation initiation factor 2B, gamma/epsilon subunits (eIF-2Bgamma/eIF-2Bepsilon)